uniref:Ig-like domain-containing protein n=1 Tax=Lates calcarifer TaxID=8187 RepID=A0A4W6CEZ8_LATCA
MLSLHYCGMFPLFLIILKGVSCQQLTPDKDEEFSLEGSSVTLSYKYSKKADGNYYFFWYRQYPGNPPEFLISHIGTGQKISDPVSGLFYEISEDKTEMYLQISSAAVTDSAVYYCAVRPTTIYILHPSILCPDAPSLQHFPGLPGGSSQGVPSLDQVYNLYSMFSVLHCPLKPSQEP